MLANEQVPILDACLMIGMDVQDDLAVGRTKKVHCPFEEVYHSDGGAEAAMRVYVDSNHLYCFAGCGYLTPVSLVAQAFDVSRQTAARELLDRAGLRPPTRAEIWAGVTQYRPAPDVAHLAQALQTYCRRTTAGWDRRQYEPMVAEQLAQCLRLLDHVDSDAAAQQWLAACKQVMARIPTTQRTETETPRR